MARPSPTPIGIAIRTERERRGWTRKKLADLLNERNKQHACTAHSVYRWETGRRHPGEYLPDLVAALGLDLRMIGDPTGLTLTEAGIITAPSTRNIAEEVDPVDRRQFIGATAGAMVAIPIGDALPAESGRRVGQSDVARIRRTVVDLRRLDDYTGGANTYPLAIEQANHTSRMINLGSYTPTVGDDLLSALAELYQFSAWTAFDADRPEEACRLAQRAANAANQAGNHALAASALSEMSYLTASGKRPDEAVAMANASLANCRDVLPVVRVVLADRLAWACARAKDVQGVHRALGIAEDAHDQRDNQTEEEPDWVYWINRDESAIMRGRCWAELRETQRAVPVLQQVRDSLPYDDTHAREVALYETWLAEAHLDAGDVEQAAAATTRAVSLAGNTASPRTDAWVRGTLQRLTAYKDVPSVRELLERTA